MHGQTNEVHGTRYSPTHIRATWDGTGSVEDASRADFYAASTFNDAPGGRRVMLAWMNNWNYAQAIPPPPGAAPTPSPANSP